MKVLIATVLSVLLLTRCAAEKKTESVPAPQAPVADSSAATATDENAPQSWKGQIKVGTPLSMFNYVGAESGDFAPMRFRNDSAVGKKILAVCADDDLCEFIGTVEWLDEVPPADASAIGQIVTVESVKRLPPAE
jgi:hypothetical protein